VVVFCVKVTLVVLVVEVGVALVGWSSWVPVVEVVAFLFVLMVGVFAVEVVLVW